jgi:Predicted membrane protein (DUF2306)
MLYLFRQLFGSTMASSVILGPIAIRRRDIARHRARMTRAYALALGAGTQAFLGHRPRRRGMVHPPPLPPADTQHSHPPSPGRFAMNKRPAPHPAANYELRID